MRSSVASTGSFQILSFALCFFIGMIKEASGQDGHLHCPDMWIAGHDVTLRCEVNRTSIATKCKKPLQNITGFIQGVSSECRIESERYNNCTNTSTPDAPCWCEKQNSTYYTFIFKFTARKYREGSWKCEPVCTDASGLLNPLVMSADPACNASVKESACTTMKCAKPGVCYLNTKENKGLCVCPNERLEADCGPCHMCDLRDGCRKWDAVVVIFFALMLPPGLVGLVIYFFLYRKTRNLPVQHNCVTEEQLQNFIERLRAACARIMNELGGYPTIVIEVTQPLLEDPSYVIISGKNYCVLSEAKKKVLSKIEELRRSCNPGTGSSHQATESRTQEERKRSGHGGIELSRLRENSLSRDSSADGMTQVDTPKGNRPLPLPRQEKISTNIIGQRLPPLESTAPKMVSVERNSYVEDQKQLPKPNTKLAPIQSSKKN